MPLVLVLALTACRDAQLAQTAEKASTPAPATADAADVAAVAAHTVNQAAGIKEGELVMITGTVRDLALLEDLAVETRKVGAHPMINLQSERVARRSYDDVAERYDTQAPKWDQTINEKVDVVLVVDPSVVQDAVADVPPQRTVARASAAAAARELALKRGVRTVELGNGLYPTAARAELMGLPQEQLASFFWAGLKTSPAELTQNANRLREVLATGTNLEITSASGTNLRVAIRPSTIQANLGVTEPGKTPLTWLPAGELFMLTVPGSANGKIVIDRLVFRGKLIENVTFEIANGKLQSFTAPSGIEPLRAVYDAAGPGKELFTIVDFGLNSGLPGTTDNAVRSYVPAGMMSFFFGRDTWAGGDNSVAFELAVFLAGATVKAKGRAIVENGAMK